MVAKTSEGDRTMMNESTMTVPQYETLRRLYDERENLIAEIEKLQEQADAAQGGIRLYRNHRVDQFREREREFATRLSRIETGQIENSFENEAETLFDDLRETKDLATRTFHQIMQA
ncbi:MAG TPA: hypothetical protein VGE01_11920 [Fimbriimonas sp.]